MKSFLFSILIAFIYIPALSQNSIGAKTLLDNVSNNYHSKNSFYLKFNSSLENNKANTNDKYSGEVYVRGNRYNLHVPSMDIQQIYDGKKLYTISKDQQEVTVTKPKANSDELFTPTRVLDIYKSGFDLSMDKKETVGGKSVQYIKLTPNTNDRINYILIGVNPKSLEMVKLLEVNKNGTTTTLTIEKQLNNIIVPNGIITFQKGNYSDFYISEI